MGLVPDSFAVPDGPATDRFKVRPLTIRDVEQDFAAVVAARSRLRGLFGTDAGWLSDDHTLEQNLIDVAWHQKNHQRRDAFTFTVVSPDGRAVLGCVYIDPSSRPGYDAEVTYWTVPDSNLEEELGAAVRAWLEGAWPFDRVAYPGRDLPWNGWRAPNQPEDLQA